MGSSPGHPKNANDNDQVAGNRLTIVRTNAVLLNPSGSDTPFWIRQIPEFEALEIRPHLVLHGSSCGSYLEPCEPQEAEVWTVNGRYASGDIEPCQDFVTKAEALAFCDQLASRYPHLAGRSD